MSKTRAFNLLSTFVQLDRGTAGHARATAIPLTRRFWSQLGIWHTLLVRKPGALLFVTPGKGTRVRPAAG